MRKGHWEETNRGSRSESKYPRVLNMEVPVLRASGCARLSSRDSRLDASRA